MKKYLVSLLVALTIGLTFFSISSYSSRFKNHEPHKIRYVALGDSYTIGEGVRSYEAFPEVLVKMLNREGVQVKLIANPSVTGWTTQDLIEKELPIYDSSRPEFATLLIGVNDWVQEVDEELFHKNLIQILDRMQTKLPDKHHLILITIPDFSVTPTGKNFDQDGDAEAGIARFNTIIKEEGKLRNLPVADIYPLTQRMKDNREFINPDGLHPSPKEYELWAEKILPIALKTLTSK
ncbi:MAG TPA: SGNH/GDSL hydrolase family protein [Candidatus Limnocylindrales bacterium]|nr:SGNH/GDSL hydrolase family protein [Candidatus Limnocylindrales bacterium]